MAEEEVPETSLSVDVTATGMTAKAKSRTVAAVDRLFGNIADTIGTRIERGNVLRKAVTEGQRVIVEAAAKAAAERIGRDETFAERAIAAHFDSAMSKQDNKEGVVRAALEDLTESPPSEAEANSGPETLDEEFVARFETYAEGATTEELRQRWGRILAAEIREPGTFSRKVLRVVDELDASTAALFERVCEHRIGDALPHCLLGELAFPETSKLVNAGLLEDSGYGILDTLHKTFAPGGLGSTDVWICIFGNSGIAVPRPFTAQATDPDQRPAFISIQNDQPGIPCKVLTAVGLALTAILPDTGSQPLRRFLAEARKQVPETKALVRTPDGAHLEVAPF